MPRIYMMLNSAPPSLVDLCVRTAIDNVRYLGDVGETDLHLLDRILPHCTLDQLMHVEKSTKGRDLSPVTDKLWKKFYELQFGVKSMNDVVKRMKQKKVSFKWKQLYEAKLKDRNEAENKAVDRLKQLYKKEAARKQSRQVQICSKFPPSSNKRGFFAGPGYNLSNVKSNIMKKAKIELMKSQEVKNLTALRRNAVQRNYGPLNSQEVKNLTALKRNAVQRNYSPLTTTKSNGFGNNSASTSKQTTSLNRRF